MCIKKKNKNWWLTIETGVRLDDKVGSIIAVALRRLDFFSGTPLGSEVFTSFRARFLDIFKFAAIHLRPTKALVP